MTTSGRKWSSSDGLNDRQPVLLECGDNWPPLPAPYAAGYVGDQQPQVRLVYALPGRDYEPRAVRRQVQAEEAGKPGGPDEDPSLLVRIYHHHARVRTY